MQYLIYFIVSFILVYIVFYFMSVRRIKKDKKRIPVEVQYLVLSYDLNLSKFSYKKFMRTIALVGSLDVAIVCTVVFNIEGIIWQLLFGLITLVPVIIISFMAVGKYYQKKQLKDNKEELVKEKKLLEKEKLLEEKKKAKKEKKKNAKQKNRK